MRIYNSVLDERLRRKDFIHERDFVDFRKIQGIEKRRTKEEKELYQKYRVFAKMQTEEDFENLMEGLVQEQKLTARISRLQEYLRMGVKTFKESVIYDKEKSARVFIADRIVVERIQAKVEAQRDQQ